MSASEWPRLQRAIERAGAEAPPSRMRRALGMIRPSRDESLAPGIYVFAFHSVVDPACSEAWERAYAKVAVTVDEFEQALTFLARHFTTISLSDALAMLDRPIERPYAVVTFDDGYRDALTNAAPVAARFGIRPAMFVNGGFADGGVYFRVLAAMLTAQGHSRVLARELRGRIPSVEWSGDGPALFDQTKNEYQRDVTEEAVDVAFRAVLGDPATLGVHLSPDDVKALETAGWEIGNHTFGHDELRGLTASEAGGAIETNETYWRGCGVDLLPCVAYPNGAAKHVGPGIKSYLDARPGLHGMFCNGGVNLRPDRTEWLRIPVSPSTVAHFGDRLGAEYSATQRAMHALLEGTATA